MPKIIPEYREEARKKIVSAGLQVMSKKGYANTSLEDIAREIGVSKGALYIYFKNKDALVIEIIKLIHEQICSIACHTAPDTGPLEVYAEILEAFLTRDLEKRALIQEIMALSARKPEFQETFFLHMQNGISMMHDCFRTGQIRGEIRDDVDPETLAVAMMAMMTGLSGSILKGMDPDDVRRRFHEIGTKLFGMREKPEAG